MSDRSGLIGFICVLVVVAMATLQGYLAASNGWAPLNVALLVFCSLMAVFTIGQVVRRR